MERITSKQNQLIKDTKRLIASSRERAQAGLFVLEGARLCLDVLNSVYTLHTLLLTDRAYEKLGVRAEALVKAAERAYLISDEVAEKLSDTENSQGVFAVCETKNEETVVRGEKVLALDNVQDPANLGAVIRTAEALGINTLLVYRGCDVFHPKALRASMGGVLRVNLVTTDNLTETLLTLKPQYRLYATVPDEAAVSISEVDFAHPSVCVIGNEANGVEQAVLDVCDARITIPMRGRAESLNASVASAITMWEMLRVR